MLGQERDAIYDAVEHTLDLLASEPKEIGPLLDEALALGRTNFAAMGPSTPPTLAPIGTPIPDQPCACHPVKGKAILVSGHDIKDLRRDPQADEGQGINVYTHGELLPAHGYPGLKTYLHLVGNYGGAWQDQQQRIRRLPWPDRHDLQLPDRAAAALSRPAVHLRPRRLARRRAISTTRISSRSCRPRWRYRASPADTPSRRSLIGFGRDTVLGIADKVIDAVKAGAIRHFFLIGGCDGAAPGRNYYTDFADPRRRTP